MAQYLCPVCRAPRKTQLKDDLPLSSHLKILSSVLALSSLSYLLGGWDLAWRACFLYLPFWAISEFIHWVKMREAAKCQACGFDPILYQKDWRAARHKIENRMGNVIEELKNQGHFIPAKLRQYAPQGMAQTANNQAAQSAPLHLTIEDVMNAGTPKTTTTRSVAPASLEKKDSAPVQGKLF
jgi:hypothetical protein